MQKMRTIMLSEDLCLRAEKRFGNLQTAEALLTFVLEQLLSDGAILMDQKEEEIIEKRLRDLGYL
jgi:hypothetical protein